VYISDGGVVIHPQHDDRNVKMEWKHELPVADPGGSIYTDVSACSDCSFPGHGTGYSP